MKTYEFKLRPNSTQEAALWKQLQLTRELYNDALAEMNTYYSTHKKHLTFYKQDKLHGKNQHPEIPSTFVDTTIKRLHRSCEHFFRRCKEGEAKKGFPRFKSANQWHSLQFRDAVSHGISGTYVRAPRMIGGDIRFNLHRKIVGLVKFCRILRKPSGWILHVICETQPQPLPPTGKSVGLDFGIKHLVADSDGNKVENPQHLKRSLRKLRIAQRIISKRKKGSNRRKKACRRAARLHERIANQRKDYLHKVARSYVNRYDTICLEDLHTSGMVQNHCLARSISDASWSMLREFIEAKAENAGRRVVAVPAHYTSQKCSECGEMVEKALSVRTHVCPHCGYVECRDTNAARNILAAGMQRSAREVNCDFPTT